MYYDSNEFLNDFSFLGALTEKLNKTFTIPYRKGAESAP